MKNLEEVRQYFPCRYSCRDFCQAESLKAAKEYFATRWLTRPDGLFGHRLVTSPTSPARPKLTALKGRYSEKGQLHLDTFSNTYPQAFVDLTRQAGQDQEEPLLDDQLIASLGPFENDDDSVEHDCGPEAPEEPLKASPRIISIRYSGILLNIPEGFRLEVLDEATLVLSHN